MSLYEEISELIDLKTEGDYWDFKVQWHENKADLLHDIICMANNLANRNAYLIIEYLWRKRFGVDLSVTEKLLLMLDSPDDWLGDFNNSDLKYHSLYPEFQIRINEIEDQREYQENSIMFLVGQKVTKLRLGIYTNNIEELWAAHF